MKKQKYCSACKTVGGNLMIHSRSAIGTIYYRCRPCNTDSAKKYRNTETGRININKAVAKSSKKHSLKQNARVLMNYYLRKGVVKKPDSCISCGEVKKLEGHHKNYDRPLEVTWLCRSCHSDLHAKLSTGEMSIA